MTNGEIKKILETSGLKVAYRAFKREYVPPLPFICFMETDTDNFFADGKAYLEIRGLRVELYTKMKEKDVEDKVEEALSSFCWNKSETYLDTEQCYQIIYEMEV